MSISRFKFIFVLVCGVIGMVGAFGQAYVIHNSLVHSYPYKMMGMPPAHFYSWIGSIGYYISVTASFLCLISIGWIKRYLIPVVPVVICPLAYLLTFEIAFLFSEFSPDDMLQRNFDGYTGETVRQAFVFEVLGLIFWGAVIGLVIGLFIFKASDLLMSRRRREL